MMFERLSFRKILEKIVSREQSFVHKIIITAFVLSVSLLLTFLGHNLMGHYFPTLGVLAVILVATYCGIIPSLIVVVVQRIFAEYFFILPTGFEYTQPEVERLFISLTLALSVSALVNFLRNSLKNTIKAKQEAEQAKLLMERVLALVTHDVRNPLAAISISTQLLMRMPEKLDQFQPMLTKILRSVEYADSMIQTLLDVSRIRAGKKLPLDYQTCDLTIQVAQMVDEMSLLHKNRINFNANEPMIGGWGIIGIRRALDNLITNAVKYGEPNTAISVSLLRLDHHVKLSVHNRGSEISAEDQRNLFIGFERTRSSESSTTKGWGLGLALVKGIAEAHAGIVKVESSNDKGTTFTLSLPIRTLEQAKNSQNDEQHS